LNYPEWHLIINPVSGGGKGKKAADRIAGILQQKNVNFSQSFTEHASHAVELTANAIKDGRRKIAIVGGDGTLNDVVNGIMSQNLVPSSEITIAMLPAGRGNDFVRTFGISSNMEKAVEQMLAGKTEIISPGKIELEGSKTRYFLNVAGAGFDAAVAHTVSTKKIFRGNYSYIIGIAYSLFKYKSTVMRYRLDNIWDEDKIFAIVAGICKFSGGGFMLTPHANHRENKLAVTVIRDIGKLDVIRYLPRLYDGSFVSHHAVSTHFCDEIEINSHPQVFLQAEGEITGTTPVKISLTSKKLNIISGNKR
jgi:diacylglycerol kinase (ATP)